MFGRTVSSSGCPPTSLMVTVVVCRRFPWIAPGSSPSAARPAPPTRRRTRRSARRCGGACPRRRSTERRAGPVTAAWAVTRAVDAASVKASTWWLVAAGSAIGFAFLTKMGQALLVVPALGLVYLVAGARGCAPGSCSCSARSRRRWCRRAGSFVLVELWPADSRPYIGGSTTNSLLELALTATTVGGQTVYDLTA
ncbi:glycosyltransferase family 39 protein [Pseudonocardia yuanmonensis]|uniref:glycosyltransferase family 39 protein n=1 Tax=Pseudonocardia yuanmonensis TaxID=1095914 RepID=UPI003CD08E17